MEEAPVTAATGVLGPVIAKLASLLGNEYKLRRQTRRDINFIRSKLKSMHSILWAIWETEDLDAVSKELKMEVFYLADDMDDAIDDFISSLENPENINGRSIQPKTQTRPFQDLKKRASDVSEQFRNKWKIKATCSLFSRKTGISCPSKRAPRAPFVLADKSQLVGMDAPTDQLIQHLVGGEESSQSTPVQAVQLQIKMASIVGMAGMGKTTLARLVYEAIENKFEARAFVSINPGSSIKEVLTSILRQVGAVLSSGASTQQLINTISNFLKEKRYMVIIDDIWHGEEWEIVRRCLPLNNMGSRIVTTTRLDDIAKKWRDDFDALIYKMDSEWNYDRKIWVCIIGEEDVTAGMVAKSDMVGEGFDCDHPVVHMCGGMPLALVCMFSALAKERAHQEQQGLRVKKTSDVQDRIAEKVKRNGIQNTPGFEPLVQSLQLGYIHLPHHMLKTCLLYCSIYPEGRQIKRDHLVRRWIAERFVYKEETAKGYLEELVNRGFIRFVRKKNSQRYDKYRVHPVMRNFLGQKLREDNFITCSSDIPLSYACRIHLLYIDDGPVGQEDPVSEETNDGCPVEGVDPMPPIDWSHIRSLVVFGSAKRVRLGQMERLRVLDLQFNGGIENDDLKAICGLLRLRHLFGLHGKGISEIPPEIGGLQHLETLEVRGTRIIELPNEIRKLQHFKNLDLKGNNSLKEVPVVIGDLLHLENLCLSRTDITDLPREIIKRLPQLKSIDISGNTSITELPSEIWNLRQLRTLNLSRTQIWELPREIGNLQKLVTLNLKCAIYISNLPREIGKLQHLEELNLYFSDVKKIPREIGELKKLKNYVSSGFDALPWEATQLSHLMGVPECVRQVCKTTDVASSLTGEFLSFHLVNMLGAGLTVGTKQMHIPRWIKDHFNDLAYLDIWICKLEEEDLKILREMPNLGVLQLNFAVVPREPVAICGEGFPMLFKLVIYSRVPRVTFMEGAMPMLNRLIMRFQFYGGPPNRDPLGIKHLRSLKVVDFICQEGWYSAETPCISAIIDVVRKEAQEHRNEVILSVYDE